MIVIESLHLLVATNKVFWIKLIHKYSMNYCCILLCLRLMFLCPMALNSSSKSYFHGIRSVSAPVSHLEVAVVRCKQTDNKRSSKLNKRREKKAKKTWMKKCDANDVEGMSRFNEVLHTGQKYRRTQKLMQMFCMQIVYVFLFSLSLTLVVIFRLKSFPLFYCFCLLWM